MSTGDQHLIEVEPVIGYPHEAQVGKSYLMTIDLRLVTLPETWPYDNEEYPVWCHLDTMPLFSHKPLSEGERAVVLHRFGGTYGSAKFLLTAAREAMKGTIHITLMNKWGSPIDYIPIEAEIKHDNVPGPVEDSGPDRRRAVASEEPQRRIPRIRQTKTEWMAILYKSDRKVDRDLVDILISCEQRGDDIGAAHTCQQIAEELRKRGEDIRLVLEAYHNARWYYGEVGDVRGQAYASQQIAEIERDLGHLQLALDAYHNARWYYGEVGDVRGQAYISQKMGEIERLQSNSKQARNYYEAALALYRNLSEHAGEADVRKALGEIEAASANWTAAREQFEKARAIYWQLKDPLAQAYLCRELGDVLLAQQQWSMAQQEYDRALSFYKQGEMPDEKARIYQGRGLALRKCGQLSLALHDYEECARLCRQIDDPRGEADALRAILEILQILELERQPLPAFARIKLENNEQVFVGKEYILQVCLGWKPSEESGGEEAAGSLNMENKLVISVELDIDGSVISHEQKKLLIYNPHEPRWIEFPFEVMEAGDHTLNIAFIHKGWLGTISFEFNAVEQPHGLVSAPEKWTEKQLLLPLHDKLRVDVSLYIRLEERRYKVQVLADRGFSEQFPMDILEADVSDFNEQLQTAIENLLEEVGQGDFDERLRKLARWGNYVWKKIFFSDGAQRVIGEALKSRAVIQIVVDEFGRFNIPWELLYDGPVDTEEVDIFHFWGMRYHVIRSLSLQSQDSPPVVIQAHRPTIGIIRNKVLKGVGAEKGGFEDLEGITVKLLPVLDENKHNEEITRLVEFLTDKDLHILHLACEASAEDPGNPYLSIANDFHVRLNELDVRRFEIQIHHPLVVLNFSQTGMLDPLYTSNWVTLFWKQGASSIVATEARVSDELATRFSKELYIHLLDGEQISQALFECRHHFWEQPEGRPEHNPIGLVYALYSSPALRIEKTV